MGTGSAIVADLCNLLTLVLFSRRVSSAPEKVLNLTEIYLNLEKVLCFRNVDLSTPRVIQARSGRVLET